MSTSTGCRSVPQTSLLDITCMEIAGIDLEDQIGLIDCCLLRTPHSLTQQVEVKSYRKWTLTLMRTLKNGDLNWVPLQTNPLLRATNSSPPEFELVLGMLYPQTITAAERLGRAQVRKGVCDI